MTDTQEIATRAPVPNRAGGGLIAVGVDFTPHSGVAAARATLLAKSTSSTLLNIHVLPGSAVVHVEPPQSLEPMVVPAPTDEGRAALRAASALAHAADVAEVPTTPLVAVGKPYEELAVAAETHGAWLLVVGLAHEISPTETLVLDTTAERALRHGSTPVLLAREKLTQPYRRVLLALDPDDLSMHLVRTVARVAPEASSYDVFHCIAPGGPEATRTRDHRTVVARSLTDLCVAGGLDPAVTTVRTFVGDPRETVSGELQHRSPDLVAIGTHAAKGLARIARGSVADHAIHAATGIDVLVVPPPK